jgi:hypothetical protein
MLRFWLLLCGLWCCGLCLSGCTILPRSNPPPPLHTLQLEQLVFQSPLPMAADHRLFQELKQLRTDVYETVGLPISNEPIQVFLLRDESEFINFVQTKFPEFPARRAFFVETDTRLAVYAYWSDRIAEDLRHEVAHGYLHACVPQIPLWLDEGLAEYFELPRQQQGRHTAHLLELQQLLSEGRWKPNLTKLAKLDDAGRMTQADYAEAWLWVHWLLHSQPQQRELLTQYLLALRRAEPIAQQLPELLLAQQPNVEQQLLSYLEQLLQQQPPARASNAINLQSLDQ